MAQQVPLALDDIVEKDWQRKVVELAKTLGYRRAYHTFDSRRSDSGFPDLVLVCPRRKRVVFLELKRERGKVTPKQSEWLRDLYLAGAEVYLVRPRHFDYLARVLAATGRTSVELAHARGTLLLELDAAIGTDV